MPESALNSLAAESVVPSPPETSADLARRFGGVARLYGDAALARFAGSHAVVIGIGGVGSWAAEALARSGVGVLTLIDLDHISESNTNRQIHAVGDAYGQAKVLAMADRIAAINPACKVRTIERFVTAENASSLINEVGNGAAPAIDVLLDCIDQVSAKAALLAHCQRSGVAVVTCGAAGGKVRYRLRRHYGFARERAGRSTRFGIAAVFSDEPVLAPADMEQQPGEPGTALACAGYGSSVVVTAPLGFAAAAWALQWLVRTPAT